MTAADEISGAWRRVLRRGGCWSVDPATASLVVGSPAGKDSRRKMLPESVTGAAEI